MRSLREPQERRIQPIKYRSETNMAEILSKHAVTRQVLRVHDILIRDRGIGHNQFRAKLAQPRPGVVRPLEVGPFLSMSPEISMQGPSG
jgi:hypothetical protein